MSFLDNFRFFELSVLNFIQQTLEPFGTLFITGCHVGDPRYPYVYFSIFLSAVGEHIAVKSLWAVIVSEWLNTLFKWILSDHRPYWWVNEYFSGENITLKQFDVTCETGPGNPSGHMMVTACVWFVVYKELTKKIFLNTVVQKTVALALISFWLIVIAFGRMYISAHFPDQCLLGLIAGLSVGVLINRFVHLINLKIRHHFLFSALIVSSLFITYWLLNAFSSVDANWSLKLASKWCVDINYVKPDTTPFFVLWRTSGAIIGTGIAFVFIHRRLKRTPKKAGKSFKEICLNILIGLFAIFANNSFLVLTKVNYSSLNSLVKVYAVCFVQYMLVPINGYLLVYFFKLSFWSNNQKVKHGK